MNAMVLSTPEAMPQHMATSVRHLSARYVLDLFGEDRGMSLLSGACLLEPGDSAPAVVSKLDFWQLCLNSVNQYNDEGHRCLSRPMPKSSWSMVFTAVNQMENLGGGLKRIAELLPVLQCGVHASVGYCARYAHLTFRTDEHFLRDTRSERYLDLIATVFLCILLWGAEQEFLPEKVRLSSELDPDDGYLLAGLSRKGFERFGNGTTISFSLADLGIRLGARRYESWGIHETTIFRRLYSNLCHNAFAASDEIVSDVRHLRVKGMLSQSDVARHLGVSVATLQRRLAMSGTNFRQLSREVRSGQLSSLLATSARLDDIADEMGFSDRRSLTRACQDWLGVTPSVYRQLYL